MGAVYHIAGDHTDKSDAAADPQLRLDRMIDIDEDMLTTARLVLEYVDLWSDQSPFTKIWHACFGRLTYAKCLAVLRKLNQLDYLKSKVHNAELRFHIGTRHLELQKRTYTGRKSLYNAKLDTMVTDPDKAWFHCHENWESFQSQPDSRAFYCTIRSHDLEAHDLPRIFIRKSVWEADTKFFEDIREGDCLHELFYQLPNTMLHEFLHWVNSFIEIACEDEFIEPEKLITKHTLAVMEEKVCDKCRWTSLGTSVEAARKACDGQLYGFLAFAGAATDESDKCTNIAESLTWFCFLVHLRRLGWAFVDGRATWQGELRFVKRYLG